MQQIQLFASRNMNKNKAFTLSEVLIALVVIGVIAAITVPTLWANYKKQESIQKLKKVYSILSQAASKAISDNGPTTSWEVVGNNAESSSVFTNKYLLPYLNITKDCGNEMSDECKFDVKTLKGDTVSNYHGYPRFFLLDGTMLQTRTLVQGDNYFTYILVDVNGKLKPNMMGRDAFVFVYYVTHSNTQLNGRILAHPYNWKRNKLLTDTTFGCNKTASGSSANYACAAIIMQDNWQMKEDYPW